MKFARKDNFLSLLTGVRVKTWSQFGEWKTQLVILNNFISSKDFEETRSIYSASKPVEIFMSSNTDDITDKLFDTFLQRFQEAIETSNERGNEFIHESVDLLYYFFHKIDIKSNN